MRLAMLTTALALALAGCGGPSVSSAPDGEQLHVVATTTVLADLVRQVGGDRVDVSSLVPAGGEVHTFDPTPADVARLAEADLLVMNGLGLDEWLLPLARDAGRADLPIVELAEDLDGVDYLEGGDDHADENGDHDDDADHRYNPHLWLNVGYARLYVERLRDELVAAEPDGVDDYTANAAAYDARLADLDAQIREQLAAIPAADRRIVSFHDAFPYFNAAYGLENVGVVVAAPGQDPSAGEVAALIAAIRQSGARAILSEAQFSDQLAQAIAAESGAQVVSDLYTDTLGDPPADTYEGAMRWNVDQIVEALR
jgi:ABC-type Zn uptake system ZnuABC Zn-binding protein ZnuA